MEENGGQVAAWDLRLTYDYGQIYLDRAWTADDDAEEDPGDRTMRLLHESFDSPHHVGFMPSHVVLNTRDRAIYDAQLRMELWAGPLPEDLGAWEEVWEFSLTFGVEGVYLSSATCDGFHLPPLPPGTYGFRMATAGTEHGRWEYPSLEEHWLLQAWPVTEPFEARMPRNCRPTRPAAEQAVIDELVQESLIAGPAASLDGARAVVRTSPFPGLREAALWQFANHPAEAETLWLERAVADEFPEVRATALRLLGAHAGESPGVLPFLLERGASDPDPTVGCAIAQILGRRWAEDPDVAAWLRGRLADPRPAVRAALLRAAVRHEVDYPPTWSADPATAALLREVAERDPDPDIRRFAGLALADGWAHDSDVVAWLRDRAPLGSDESVAAAAVAAAAAVVNPVDLLPWLRQRALDGRPQVRSAAVAAVSRVWASDAPARAWSIDLVESAEHADLRAAALKVVAENLVAPTAGDDLQLLLRDRAAVDPDAGVRWTAITAVREWLGRSGRGRRGTAEEAVRADWRAWSERQIASERELLALALTRREQAAPAAPSDAPSWERLLQLMAAGPDPGVRGAVRCLHSGSQFLAVASVGDEPTVLAGMRYRGAPENSDRPLNVWWSGQRLRLAEPDGTVELIVGDRRCWQFVDHTDVPIVARRRALAFFASGTALLTRSQAARWQQGGAEPIGPIEATRFLGRAAWAVSVAVSNEEAQQLVVDAETGILLQRTAHNGAVDEWVELVVGEDLDENLFAWYGPTRSAREWADAQRAAGVDVANRAARWFGANVPTRTLRVTVDLALQVYDVDEATGAFTAGLGSIGVVARRPRSADRWTEHWAVSAAHRWRSDRWDWALSFHGAEPTPESVAAIKRRLVEECG